MKLKKKTPRKNVKKSKVKQSQYIVVQVGQINLQVYNVSLITFSNIFFGIGSNASIIQVSGESLDSSKFDQEPRRIHQYNIELILCTVMALLISLCLGVHPTPVVENPKPSSKPLP